MRPLAMILVAALSWGSLSAQQVTINEIIDSYLDVKNALVAGNVPVASEKAHALAAAIKSYNAQISEPKGQTGLENNVLRAAEAIASAKKIEQQRTELALLSDLLWERIKDNKLITRPLFYHQCPMKKAHWISESKAIQNPFYGAQMISCGTNKESINN